MILIGLVEAIAVAWVYGADRLMDNVEEMRGPFYFRGVRYLWIICWKIVAPISLGVTLNSTLK